MVNVIISKSATTDAYPFRDMIIHLDSQQYTFKGDGWERVYSPTMAEWNYVKAGLLAFDKKIPNADIEDKTKLDYKPELHLNPGTWS